MKFHVFVNSIVKNEFHGTTVEASNGKPEGPPFVRFDLQREQVKDCYIGKGYVITIEET